MGSVQNYRLSNAYSADQKRLETVAVDQLVVCGPLNGHFVHTLSDADGNFLQLVHEEIWFSSYDNLTIKRPT